MKRRTGRIINITSVVEARQPGQANYAAAKAGVAGMSRALARSPAAATSRSNCGSRRAIDTDMTKELPDAQREACRARSLGRLWQARRNRAVVGFLALRQRPT